MTEQETPKKTLVLVIDEVAPVVRLLELELNLSGFETRTVLMEDDAIGTAVELQPDAIVLGGALPVPAVYETLLQLKGRVSAPIIFLHAGGNEADGAIALDMGADDVLSRPYSPIDLTLRLQALLHIGSTEENRINRAGIEIDVLHRVVHKPETTVALGTSEWGLLLQLARAEGLLPSSELLKGVWGDDYAEETHFLSLWISRLRTTLGDDPGDPTIIIGDMESGFRLAD